MCKKIDFVLYGVVVLQLHKDKEILPFFKNGQFFLILKKRGM